MKEDKKITQADIDQAEVRLRSIAGISPRFYLPVIYIFLSLALVFLLFVLPGIRKNGSYLTFSGLPAKSAVYVDGSYKGSSAQAIYLSAGSYTLRIEHEGFEPETRKIVVGGRIFGSLFFKRREKVDFALAPQNPGDLLRAAYSEYAAWALAGKPSALYPIPPLLSDALAAIGPAAAADGQTGGGLPDAGSFTADLLSAAASAESARDGLKAAVLLNSRGMPGPLSLVSSARRVAAALGAKKTGALWLQDVVSKKTSLSSRLAETARAAALEFETPAAPGGAAGAADGAKTAAPRAQGSLSLAGHSYVLFSAGSITMGGEAPSGSRLPYAVELPLFGIAKTEVTKSQWAAFLDANAKWRPENKEALIEQGLADEDYLADWTKGGEEPVTGVSWAAASAYCAWLSDRAGSAYKVVLPSEAMWEAAARAGAAGPDSLAQEKAVWADGSRRGPSRAGAAGYAATGIADLFGNVWEWTSDAYRPYPAFASGLLDSGEKTLRGGSWANAPGSVTLYSRGGLAFAHASPFLGFRPAILRR